MQVGGRHTALLEHISAVEQHPSLGKDIDFKLARSSGPLNDTAVRESGFNGLQVSLCKVSLTRCCAQGRTETCIEVDIHML